MSVLTRIDQTAYERDHYAMPRPVDNWLLLRGVILHEWKVFDPILIGQRRNISFNQKPGEGVIIGVNYDCTFHREESLAGGDEKFVMTSKESVIEIICFGSPADHVFVDGNVTFRVTNEQR